MPFYAVAVGREVGVKNTWRECRTLIWRYPGARYKKFESKEQAEAWIQEIRQSPEFKDPSEHILNNSSLVASFINSPLRRTNKSKVRIYFISHKEEINEPDSLLVRSVHHVHAILSTIDRLDFDNYLTDTLLKSGDGRTNHYHFMWEDTGIIKPQKFSLMRLTEFLNYISTHYDTFILDTNSEYLFEVLTQNLIENNMMFLPMVNRQEIRELYKVLARFNSVYVSVHRDVTVNQRFQYLYNFTRRYLDHALTV